MKKLITSTSAGTALLMITACSIFPSPRNLTIHYYDIGFPPKQYKSKVGVQIFPFIGGVGDEVRMVFRHDSNNVQFDSYNRWSSSPAKLMQCYLSLALNNNKSKIDYSMTGEVLRFEGDLAKKTANIAIKITLKSTKKSKEKDAYLSQIVYSSSVPVEKETATAYAVAMEQAMAKITQQIVKNIQTLKTK